MRAVHRVQRRLGPQRNPAPGEVRFPAAHVQRAGLEEARVIRRRGILHPLRAHELVHVPAAAVIAQISHQRPPRLRAHGHILMPESAEQRVLHQRAGHRIDLTYPAVGPTVQTQVGRVREALELMRTRQPRMSFHRAQTARPPAVWQPLGRDILVDVVLKVLLAGEEGAPRGGRAAAVAHGPARGRQQGGRRPAEAQRVGRRRVVHRAAGHPPVPRRLPHHRIATRRHPTHKQD
jgi:hypothetical protein